MLRLFALLALAALVACSSSASRPASSQYAYVTLMSGEQFISGTRVLGASLRASGTKHDIVVMVTEAVSAAGRKLLADDGWRVVDIHSIRNPHEDHFYFKQRLLYAFSKMNIFAQYEYRRVVYLDSDIIAVENIDHMFECAKFCSVMRNGFFNTGVMVVTPDPELYESLHSSYAKLPSYNGGEQGFMNSYYPRFDECAAFDPKQPALHSQEECARMPPEYNGDIGVYYLHDSHWVLPRGASLKVLHFTMGPFKPWQWWSFALVDIHWMWHAHAQRLQPPLVSDSVFFVYAALPLALAALAYWANARGYVARLLRIAMSAEPFWLRRLPVQLHIFVGPLTLLLTPLVTAGSLTWSLLAEREFNNPWHGWIVALLWFHIVFYLLAYPSCVVLYGWNLATRARLSGLASVSSSSSSPPSGSLSTAASPASSSHASLLPVRLARELLAFEAVFVSSTVLLVFWLMTTTTTTLANKAIDSAVLGGALVVAMTALGVRLYAPTSAGAPVISSSVLGATAGGPTDGEHMI